MGEEMGIDYSPHHVYVCSKVNDSSVDTMCSSCPSNTVRLASEPAAVTMQDLTPNAVATAAAYEIAPPCIALLKSCIYRQHVLLCQAQRQQTMQVYPYQSLFLVHNVDCQVAHKQHWGPAVRDDVEHRCTVQYSNKLATWLPCMVRSTNIARRRTCSTRSTVSPQGVLQQLPTTA